MWTQSPVTQRLGIRYPIFQGPFGGGISSTALAAAVSNGGALGGFGAHCLRPEQITGLVAQLKQLTPNPFNINLWVPTQGERSIQLTREEFATHVARLKPYFDELEVPLPEYPESFAPDYDAQVEAVLDAKPPVFSFIFGIPAPSTLERCRSLGIKTVGTATHVAEVLAMDAAGVDVIVASGSEAGGHRASWLQPAQESPSTLALIPQVAGKTRAPIVAAGGMANGSTIAAAFALGAQGVQVGTAFVACQESNTHDTHRRAIRSDASRVTLLTKAFSGRYARGIKNRFMTELDRLEAELPPYPIQNWLTGPLRKAAGAAGRTDLAGLWAGQNAPLARHERAAELLEFLVEDTNRALQRLREL